MNDNFDNYPNNSDREVSLIDRFSPISDGEINPDGIVNLICVALSFFFVLFLYQSLSVFQYLLIESFDPSLFIHVFIPHLHLGLAIYFLVKRYPQGWQLIVAYFTISFLFSIQRLADFFYFDQTSDSIIDGLIPAPITETLSYLGIYIVVLYIFLRKEIRSLFQIDGAKKKKGFILGVVMFLIYSFLSFAPGF
ncbi:MAG: hypothetical protein AAFQ94_20370 [Bacteroidota bacterium]